MDPADASRARRAAAALVTELGGEVHEVVDLQDSNRLTVRLLPCDTVARIGPADPGGAEVEVERARHLTEAGAPVGPLDPRFPARVHHRDGLEITLWTFLPPLPRPEVPAEEYARALAALHAGLRSAPLPAPSLTERIGSGITLLEDPARTPDLRPKERTLLLTTLRELTAQVTAHGAQQVLHGEPHPGNLVDTPGGPRFIDLEALCRGPVEFDLAHGPAAVAAHYPGADRQLLADCRTLSLALATTWRWDREDTLPDGRLLGVAWLHQVRALREHRRRPDAAPPTLTILTGLPGSGKTTAAARIVKRTGASPLSADAWMDRLGASLWDGELRERVEEEQWRIGQELLAAGVSVVVDWGTWGRDERDRLRERARELGARVALHVLDAPDEELLRRITARGAEDPPITAQDVSTWRRTFQGPPAQERALFDAASGPGSAHHG